MSNGPSNAEFAAILKQIGDIAAVAGVRGGVDAEVGAFVTGFSFDGGRDHRVFVRPTGRADGGRVVVTFESAAYEYPKKKFLTAISQKDLIDLLRKNEGLMFARYALAERKDAYLVIASADCLLDTLDGPEFMLAANAVAMAADAYEAVKGVDKF
jgi:hypothetical protein